MQHWAKQWIAKMLINQHLKSFILVTTNGVVHMSGGKGRDAIISSAAAPCSGNI